MLTRLKTILPAAVLTLALGSASAQITRDTFSFTENGEKLQIVGAVVQAPAELTNLQIPESKYPLFILPRRTAQQFFKVYSEKDSLLSDRGELSERLRLQLSLDSLELNGFRSIIKVKDAEIKLGDTTIKRLNEQITALDTQLTQTRDIALDFSKGYNRRNLMGVLLGGGIGLGIGILLGVIAAK